VTASPSPQPKPSTARTVLAAVGWTLVCLVVFAGGFLIRSLADQSLVAGVSVRGENRAVTLPAGEYVIVLDWDTIDRSRPADADWPQVDCTLTSAGGEAIPLTRLDHDLPIHILNGLFGRFSYERVIYGFELAEPNPTVTCEGAPASPSGLEAHPRSAYNKALACEWAGTGLMVVAAAFALYKIGRAIVKSRRP
jgi:hypothetical protein